MLCMWLTPHPAWRHRLEEARTVLLERKRRRQARSAARRDMKEQRAAKLLAEEQTEQRRKAALERKATLDAEIAARADVRQAKAALWCNVTCLWCSMLAPLEKCPKKKTYPAEKTESQLDNIFCLDPAAASIAKTIVQRLLFMVSMDR